MNRCYDMDEIVSRIVSSGKGVSENEAEALSSAAGTDELLAAAEKVTAVMVPRKFDTCSIINAKSGRCPEDSTGVPSLHIIIQVRPYIRLSRTMR